MKKLLTVIFTVFLFANTAMASDQYNAAVARIRNEKNAQMRVINAQIKAVEQNIERVSLNTSMSEKQRAAKLASYEKQLETLNNKKHQIKEKYKADKKKLQYLK